MAGKKTAEFMIVNRRSGKALQATGLDNGLVVEQAEPVKTDAQIWTSVETESGVKLFNKACGKVLDVMANGTANGTWVQTWEDVDGESQLWKLVTVTATYKKIINVMSGKALDIVDMSNENGAPAQIWEDVEGEGQQWKFVSAAPKTETKTVRKPAVKKAEAKMLTPTTAKETAKSRKPLRVISYKLWLSAKTVTSGPATSSDRANIKRQAAMIKVMQMRNSPLSSAWFWAP